VKTTGVLRTHVRSAASGIAVVIGGVLLLPGVARAQEAPIVAPPPMPEKTSQTTAGPRMWMVESGAVAFGFAYVPMVVVGASSSLNADRTLLVPLVGPWIDLAQRPSCTPGMTCSSESSTRALLVVDGVFQALGALMFVGGLVTSESRTVPLAASSPTVRISPAQLGTRGYGMAALGTF
jgi:hypothetical protein